MAELLKVFENLFGFSAPEEVYILLMLYRCGVFEDKSYLTKFYKYLKSNPISSYGK